MAVLPLLKGTAVSWSDHKGARLGAALAYYSIFSIGPLILIAIAIAGLVFGTEAVRGEVATQLRGLLGETGATAINGMLAGASKPQEGMSATLFGISTLLFAAIGVVVQLKDALNTVWEVPSSKSGGVWGFVRTYLVSLAGVLSLGFLLLVSLLFTTLLAAGTKYVEPWLPEIGLQATGFVVSFSFITLLFAMMFKWLPDANVAWRDVWLGAAVTALLFEVGKFLIGLYIGKQGLESTFGAAASLVVLLIWVYYSSQIMLLGAEFTRTYAMHYGSLRHQPRVSSASQSSNSLKSAAARGSPYGMAVLALCVGWAFGLLLQKGQGSGGQGVSRLPTRLPATGFDRAS
jgi:membrane protein